MNAPTYEYGRLSLECGVTGTHACNGCACACHETSLTNVVERERSEGQRYVYKLFRDLEEKLGL